MSEAIIPQDGVNQDIPTPKQFRANFKEIFDAETTFGSSRAARLELLESVTDIIQEYIKHDCSIVYLHGKLKEAGYSGSRKELSEWLAEKGLRTKRELSAPYSLDRKILSISFTFDWFIWPLQIFFRRNDDFPDEIYLDAAQA